MVETNPLAFGLASDHRKYSDGSPVQYNSFSGTDISAQILLPNEPVPLDLGELQTISYSMHRENKPVRVLGRVNPKGFVKGPRCLPASSKVLIRDKGYISIADVQVGDYVQSSGFTWDKVLGSYNQGMKRCLTLKLKGGFSLTASYDHPIYTQRGWVNMEELTTVDNVFVAGFAPSPEEDFDIADDTLRLIAYLIGDGSTHTYKKKDGLSKEHRITLAIADTEMNTIGSDSQRILEQLDIPYRDHHTDGCINRVISVCLMEKGQTDWCQREYNLLHESLLKFGMYDKYSHNKFIPQELIAKLSQRQIAIFLNHLFSTDGCYSVEKKTNVLTAQYCSTSEELIDEVRLMLLKMGIVARKEKSHLTGDIGGRPEIVSRHNTYKLIIKDNLHLLKFFKRIGIFGKDDRVNHLLSDIRYKIKTGLKVDTKTFLDKAQQVISETGQSIFSFKQHNIYNYNLDIIAPAKAKRLADLIGSESFSDYVELLIDALIDSDEDFIQAKVKSLNELGILPVYDLEVEDRHSFICNFIKVHNTIAGSMIFTVFDAYAFYRLAEYKNLVNGTSGGFELAQTPMYPLADMLPPFDMVLTFVNEYGKSARMKIFGITIVDEGGTMSIDDLITESTFTYMARGIQPLVAYNPINHINPEPVRGTVHMITFGNNASEALLSNHQLSTGASSKIAF